MRKPFVSIVVLNYNRPQDTIECVRSLRAVSYPSFNILVVDNGSTDGSVHKLKEVLKAAEIARSEKNLGYTGGINFGFLEARRKNPNYVLVMNNDTIAEPEFLDHLVEAMESNQKAAAACGTIYCFHEKRKVWYAGGRLIPWRGLAVHENKDAIIDPQALNGARNVSFVTGCMVIFRTTIFDSIGMEDERFFMYLDDIELSHRIQGKGFDLLYVPKSIIYHKVLGEKESPFKVYYSVRNRLLLISTCTQGFVNLVAKLYFLTVITFKLIVWRLLRPEFFKAASWGLKDYFDGRFYEGRGMAFFLR